MARPSSPLEEQLLQQLQARQVPAPVREHQFHPRRKWRFDLAWPALRLAVEIDGGAFATPKSGPGRHNRGMGMTRDNQKLNRAQIMGWTVLRYTSPQIRSAEAADEVAAVVLARSGAAFSASVSCQTVPSVLETGGAGAAGRLKRRVVG